MAKKLKSLLLTKYNLSTEVYQLLMYLVMGVLTTLISISSFYLFDYVVAMDYRLANLLSWLVSVLFAYLSNRTFVFYSEKTGLKDLLVEFLSFTSSRLVTLVIEMLLLIILVEWLNLSTLIAKVMTNVVVLVLNYLLSKLLVFR